MNELEQALTAAIKATAAARREIYGVCVAADDEAYGLLKQGDDLRAVVAGINEGELRGYADMLSMMLTSMRAMRKSAARRAASAAGASARAQNGGAA